MIKSLCLKNTLDLSLEDTRTSTVIGTLLYLPDDCIWRILRNSCFHSDHLPAVSGNLVLNEFWPHWTADKTSNVSFVEPDVFLSFEKLDVIIEVKRSDWGGQDPDRQWLNEAVSYRHEYGNDKYAILIALGGNDCNQKEMDIPVEGYCPVKVFRCTWNNLRTAVEAARNDAGPRPMKQILEDVVEACEVFGFKSYVWFDDRIWQNCEIAYSKEKPIMISRGENAE